MKLASVTIGGTAGQPQVPITCTRSRWEYGQVNGNQLPVWMIWICRYGRAIPVAFRFYRLLPSRSW